MTKDIQINDNLFHHRVYLTSPMVHRGVQALLDAGIKLLALDFDLTICSAHTHGMFNGSADDLRGWVLGSGYI